MKSARFQMKSLFSLKLNFALLLFIDEERQVSDGKFIPSEIKFYHLLLFTDEECRVSDEKFIPS